MNAANLYSLVMLLHLAAIIVFVAGLLAAALVLAALSVQREADLSKSRGLAMGMRRWHRVVTTPALLVVWACGIWMALRVGWFASGWLHAKLVIVVALSALQGVESAALRRAATPGGAAPSRMWLALPPLSVVAVGAVVWLAIVKPF